MGGGLGLLQHRAAKKYVAAIGSAWRGEDNRAHHDRRVDEATGKLWQTLEQEPVEKKLQITIMEFHEPICFEPAI